MKPYQIQGTRADQFSRKMHTCSKSENCCTSPKYIYQRSRAVGDFYATGIEIWAGFGPVWQLLRPFFFKNIVDSENIFGIE